MTCDPESVARGYFCAVQRYIAGKESHYENSTWTVIAADLPARVKKFGTAVKHGGRFDKKSNSNGAGPAHRTTREDGCEMSAHASTITTGPNPAGRPDPGPAAG
jgi:hypothetical protein